MEQIVNLDNIVSLGLLILLQAVLGFDNLLYISLESKRAPIDKQALVRRIGIGIAIVFRIILLLALIKLIQYFQDPLFGIHLNIIEGSFNLHSIIVLLGGVFIIYTSIMEIFHMIGLEDLGKEKKGKGSVGSIIFWIVTMNLVFSFDSILSAMALSKVFWVMATAIVIGGLLMIWLSDGVAEFLQKNKMYEVLGLFILFVVGIMLLTEGGHLAHLTILGQTITPMSKTTFYFVITVLVLTDLVQSRYQKRLLKLKEIK
ncbi:MAG: tellurium resistance protein TerC [Candidatus Dadabacteria bacterium]|nr:tellurium resistance protein TerC [Candidatus Dadabacteria bacterium]